MYLLTELWIICPYCLYARAWGVNPDSGEDPETLPEILPRCEDCRVRMRVAPLDPNCPQKIEAPRKKGSRVPVCKMNFGGVASGSRVDKNHSVRSDTGSGQRKEEGGRRVTETQTEQRDYVSTMLEGLEFYKARDDGSVITIKAEDNKTTVAEICHGKRQTRLNFKSAVPADMLVEGLELGGKSKSWGGGGAKITDENLDAATQTLAAVVASIQPSDEEPEAADEPSVEEAQAVSEHAQEQRGQAKQRTRRSGGRSRAKANA